MSQSPYGGGGFPPPWMSNSAKSDDDSGVEWGDGPPPQEPGSDTPEPPGLSWDWDGSAEAGVDFAAPASGYQDHAVQADNDYSPAPMGEERPHDFDSILGAFSGTAVETTPPARSSRDKTRTPKPKKTRAPRPKGQVRASRKKVLVPLGAVAAVAVLVGGGFLGYGALTDDRGPEAAEASVTPGVSRAVPTGWSQATAWTSPADVASNLSVRNDYVAYLNTAGVLVVVDGKTGETIFSSTPTGADPADARVIVTQVGEAPVAVVVQETSVTAWALGDDIPEPKVNDIPSSASVSSGGSGIMMIANGETWRMNSSLGMEKVEGLPEDNTSLGMTQDGSIISGSPKGGWSINDGKKSAAVKVEMAEGAEGKVMYPARASKGIVVAWAPTSDRNTRAVGVYSAEDGTALATTTMPTAQVNLGLPLVVTDGGRLASAGSWLIDLERGETEEVEGWGTTIGTASELYGKTSEGKFVWRGSGAPEAIPEDAAVPWGTTSEDKAVVISTDENGGKVIAALDKES